MHFALWMSPEIDWELVFVELSCVCVELKSEEELCLYPYGTRAPGLAISGQYLKVRQRKLGTIIIHIVHISYSMIVRT
jgi:hypothetical protein